MEVVYEYRYAFELFFAHLYGLLANMYGNLPSLVLLSRFSKLEIVKVATD
jgi:hypothetical protein